MANIKTKAIKFNFSKARKDIEVIVPLLVENKFPDYYSLIGIQGFGITTVFNRVPFNIDTTGQSVDEREFAPREDGTIAPSPDTIGKILFANNTKEEALAFAEREIKARYRFTDEKVKINIVFANAIIPKGTKYTITKKTNLYITRKLVIKSIFDKDDNVLITSDLDINDIPTLKDIEKASDKEYNKMFDMLIKYKKLLVNVGRYLRKGRIIKKDEDAWYFDIVDSNKNPLLSADVKIVKGNKNLIGKVLFCTKEDAETALYLLGEERIILANEV